MELWHKIEILFYNSLIEIEETITILPTAIVKKKILWWRHSSKLTQNVKYVIIFSQIWGVVYCGERPNKINLCMKNQDT